MTEEILTHVRIKDTSPERPSREAYDYSFSVVEVIFEATVLDFTFWGAREYQLWQWAFEEKCLCRGAIVWATGIRAKDYGGRVKRQTRETEAKILCEKCGKIFSQEKPLEWNIYGKPQNRDTTRKNFEQALGDKVLPLLHRENSLQQLLIARALAAVITDKMHASTDKFLEQEFSSDYLD